MAVQDFGYAVVSHTDDVSGDPNWTVDAKWYADRLTMGVAPSISEAVVHLDYGNIKRRGAQSFAVEQRKDDWFGKFVRIEVANAGIDWSGVIVQQNDKFGSGDYGTQFFTVVDWAWYLSRSFYMGSWCEDLRDGSAMYQNRPLGFNTGYGYHTDSQINKGHNKAPGALLFSGLPESSSQWTAAQAIDYLITRHINNTTGGALLMPRPLRLSDFARDYLTYHPTVRPEGRTVWELLSKIIPPSRGLVWFIDWGQDNSDFVLNVTSMTPSPITLPSGLTIPAALVQKDVENLSADAQLSIDVRYDRKREGVIMRGALQRQTYTASVQSGQLVEGWPFGDSRYQRYLDGGLNHPNHPGYAGLDGQQKRDLNDRIRKDTELSAIFSLFMVPPNWDYKCNELGGTGDFRDVYDSVAGNYIQPDHVANTTRFASQTTLISGVDYTDPENPVNLPAAGVELELEPPMAFANKNPGGSPYYVQVEDVGGDAGLSDPDMQASYRILCSRTRAGLILDTGKPAHVAAKNIVTAYEPSNYTPEIDYREIIWTLTAETSYYAEGKYPDTTDPNGPVNNYEAGVTTIEMGDRFRYDTILPQTVWGVDDGDLRWTSNTNVVALRDDRPALRDLARLAYEWYAVQRATMHLRTSLNDTVVLGLGFLVNNAGYATADRQVNASISQMRMDFREGMITYSGGFAELDFTLIA